MGTTRDRRFVVTTTAAREERRVALVTGCARRRGIGGAIARRLAAAGFAVIVSDVRARGAIDAPTPREPTWQGLPSLVEELTSSGADAALVLGDVSRPDDAHTIVDFVVQRYGRLDVLVNNAASPVGADRRNICDVPLEAWDRVLEVTLRGAFLMCRATIPVMRLRHWGRIVNISSISGTVGSTRTTAYAAAKAGLEGFTRSLALDVGPWGITANAVAPGAILTDRVYEAWQVGGVNDVGAERERRAALVPVGRLGMPEDIAEAVAYLASPGSGFLTGQALTLNGGWLMSQPERWTPDG